MSSAIHVALNSTSNQVSLNIVHWTRATCRKEGQGHTPDLQLQSFLFLPCHSPRFPSWAKLLILKNKQTEIYSPRSMPSIDKRQRNKKYRGYGRPDSFALGSSMGKRAKVLCPKEQLLGLLLLHFSLFVSVWCREELRVPTY